MAITNCMYSTLIIITVHDYSAVLFILLPPLSLVYKKIQYWHTLSASLPEAFDA